MRFETVLLVIAGTLFATGAGAWPAAREETLPNGLRVLLAPDSLAPGVDVAVWYRAGSRFERAGSRGVTHLMERMMFRGSRRYAAGDHRRLLGEQGANVGTFAAPDYTCFYEVVPSASLALALRLEADRMGGVRATEATLAAERSAAAEEQSRRGESAISVGLQALYAAAYGTHPYAAPIAGRPRERSAVTLATLTAYQRARFSPSNALLTLAGNFDPDTALALVRRGFGALPAAPVPAAPAAALPADDNERRGSAIAPTPLPVLFVGWRAPGAADSSRVTLAVLSRLLTDGPSSALARALVHRKQPFAVGVQGDVDVQRESALLYAVVPSRPDVDTSAVEGVLTVEVTRLGRDTVSTADLERVKHALELEWRSQRQTSHGRAQAMGSAAILSGDWREADRDLARLRAVSPEDVRALAARVLVDDRSAVVWVRPAGEVSR